MQDESLPARHRLADDAWASGFYDELAVPVGLDGEVRLSRDEGIRPTTSPQKLAGLKLAFRSDGVITAGNASPLNDGVSAVLIGSEQASSRIGLAPLARIAGRGVSALEPQMFGFAPVEAAERALKRAGISWPDVSAVELNQAFAVQALACVDAWKIDPAIVNTRGARSRSAIRSAPPAAGFSAPSPHACARRGSGGASPRSASVSDRPWQSCWRT